MVDPEPVIKVSKSLETFKIRQDVYQSHGVRITRISTEQHRSQAIPSLWVVPRADLWVQQLGQRFTAFSLKVYQTGFQICNNLTFWWYPWDNIPLVNEINKRYCEAGLGKCDKSFSSFFLLCKEGKKSQRIWMCLFYFINCRAWKKAKGIECIYICIYIYIYIYICKLSGEVKG